MVSDRMCSIPILYITLCYPAASQMPFLKMSSSDPYDPSRKVVRKIVVSSNDWVSIIDGGSPAVIFVPRGYCWVEGTSPETRDSSELDSRDYGPVCCALLIE